ncbi:MAG TPA: hypothetical protein VE288_00230 [Rubrobacteraceae bacterium]|jgi:hypothetical protein|nr:hypothetical protein [Rubrobacteraceae bacterium]
MRANSFAQQRPLWLISKHNNCPMEVLTVRTNGEQALPVFSFKEEAETFLRLEAPSQEGLRARETTRGELISVLYGPCAGVKQMLLDPLPPQVGGEAMNQLVSLGSEEFVRDFLMSETAKEIAIPDYLTWDFAEASTREAPIRTGANRY